MRVICVDLANLKPCHCGSSKTSLIEGSCYNATQDCSCENGYDISEEKYCVSCGRTPVSYAKRRFIQLSEIDETQLHINSVKEVEV